MKDFDGYVELMSELLRIPKQSGLDPSDSIYDDWGLDSLQAFELIVLTEGLAGLSVPPEDIPALFLISDAYGYYELCLKLVDSERD
jgi:acyl carrier protein